MKISYRPRALRDLKHIVRYVREDNPHAAFSVRERIEQSVTILKDHPMIGRETILPGLYKWSVPGLPYAAYYRIEKDRVRIARILHGAQQWPDSYFV